MVSKAPKLWKSFPYILKAVKTLEVGLTQHLREQSCPQFELSALKWFSEKYPGLIFLISGLLAFKGLVYSSFEERK